MCDVATNTIQNTIKIMEKFETNFCASKFEGEEIKNAIRKNGKILQNIKNNVITKLIISYKQYPKSYRHNQGRI